MAQLMMPRGKSSAPSAAQHGKHIPNLSSQLWKSSWATRNKTYTYARNLMRNIDYYSRPNTVDPAATAATRLEFAMKQGKRHERLSGDGLSELGREDVLRLGDGSGGGKFHVCPSRETRHDAGIFRGCQKCA